MKVSPTKLLISWLSSFFPDSFKKLIIMDFLYGFCSTYKLPVFVSRDSMPGFESDHEDYSTSNFNLCIDMDPYEEAADIYNFKALEADAHDISPIIKEALVEYLSDTYSG